VEAEVKLYDRLFSVEQPDADPQGRDFKTFLNTHSLEVLKGCRLERSLRESRAGVRYQFERVGYFWLDPNQSFGPDGKPQFSRIISLKDSWAKEQGK